MADFNYFEHAYNDKDTQYYKDKWLYGNSEPYKLGIKNIYPDVQGYGKGSISPMNENIFKASGYRLDPEKMAQLVFKAWVESPGHNATLLMSDGIDYYGFNVHKASDGTIYATYENSELVTWNTIK